MKNSFEYLKKSVDEMLTLNNLTTEEAQKMSMPELDKAIKHLNDSIRLDEKNTIAISNLGNAYKYQGDKNKAIECYKKAIILDPLNPDAQNNLGLIMLEERNYDRAKECFQNILDLDPNHPSANLHMGVISLKEEDFPRSQVFVERYLDTNIDDEEGLALLGKRRSCTCVK